MPRNLLVLCTDEHRRDALGCMGHPLVRTPHLDALAARGAVFENAYTPSPICVPARAALATGLPVHATGHWDSAAPYAGQPRSWMHDARDAGAETVSIGKLHFRATEDDNGFTREILPMHVMGGTGWIVGLLREDPPPYDATAGLAADVGPGESDYTRYDRAVAEAAEAWLAARRGNDARWAAFVSFVSPHYPLRAPPAFHDLYDPDDMPMPVAHREQARPAHPELRTLARFYDYDRHFRDAAHVRAAKAAYFGLVSFVDDCVGRVLAALDASGQAEQTLVVFVADHGEMLGDHGLWTKSVMYEASAGVPMIVAGPGVPVGRRVGTPASLLEVALTARAVFGVDEGVNATPLPSRSLVAVASVADDPDRTAFSEYHDGGSGTGAFMIRFGRWKYVYYAGLAPQLFDLADDPLELADLAGSSSPAARAARDEGARRLRHICDPEAVNARAFADQRRRIAALGGAAACRRTAFGFTPVPGSAGGAG